MECVNNNIRNAPNYRIIKTLALNCKSSTSHKIIMKYLDVFPTIIESAQSDIEEKVKYQKKQFCTKNWCQLKIYWLGLFIKCTMLNPQIILEYLFLDFFL